MRSINRSLVRKLKNIGRFRIVDGQSMILIEHARRALKIDHIVLGIIDTVVEIIRKIF